MRSEPSFGLKALGGAAVVFGGASGLGAATTEALHRAGMHVVVADLDDEGAARRAASLGERASALATDVTREEEVGAAIASIPAGLEFRAAVVCAGVGHVERIVGRRGRHALAAFERVIAVNLVGGFNVLVAAAESMASNQPDEDGERGAVVLTSSVAAFDGQVGQIAYAASKAAISGMVLPAARDMAGLGIRICAIAPGTFETPLLADLPLPAREGLAAQVPFPKRLGHPAEFGAMVAQILANPMMNGETIRLDGALRMPPS